MYFLCRSTARPLCKATTSALPLFFAACARTQSCTAVRICTRGGKRKPYPGPDTEAASARSCFIMCNTHYMSPCARP